VDESTLRRWADTGRLRVYRTPGGHRRFSLTDLESMVAGDNRHRGSEEIERIAVAKIRRQLQRARQQEHGWYATLSDHNRDLLRDLGRRLVEMAGEYVDKRTRRSGLLEEAMQVGEEYGRILIDAGLPLPNAVNAYIGFRKTMDETTRQTAIREGMPLDEALSAYGQVHALGDQVLLGMTAVYEALPAAVGAENR
jgi:excisionase family DNA binding protein